MRYLGLPLFVILISVLSSCNNKELERLRTENDSLRHELENRHNMMMVMGTVKSLIDSIDANRNLLRIELTEGTSQDDFAKRLQDINQYVKNTEEKIQDLEKGMKASKQEASAYLLMMDALKGELAIRVEEVEKMEEALEHYKTENTSLIKTVNLQEQQMSQLQSKILTKQQELKLLEAKVSEMVDNFKVTEAEAYYARGKAVEEAANRTHLAPKKRKETYREALELYKKSLDFGKADAKADIERIQKKI